MLSSMDDIGRTGDEVLDTEAIADALDVLDDLREWQLAPARWERVRDALDRLESALLSRDFEATWKAVAELELAGPVRVTRIGTNLLTSAPPEVRDRRNRLVHSLGGDAHPDREEEDDDEPDAG